MESDKKIYIICLLLFVIVAIGFGIFSYRFNSIEADFNRNIEKANQYLTSKIEQQNNQTVQRLKNDFGSQIDNLLVMRDGQTLPDGRFVLDKQKQEDMLLAEKVLQNFIQKYDSTEVEVIRVEVSGADNDRIMAVYGQRRNDSSKKVILPNGTVERIG